MLSHACILPASTHADDLRNLIEYFVKIPANVAKGTPGASGERWSKERVREWMLGETGFDVVAEQMRATTGDHAWARAAI
jgi:hypothetical protein